MDQQQPLYPPQPQFNPISAQIPQVPPPTPPHTHRKWVILSIAALLLIVIGGASAWYFMRPKAQTCLTRSDYQAVANETLPDDAPFMPTVDFYGFDIQFDPNAATYSGQDIESQLEAIAVFAKQHPGTSLNVTLQGFYTESTKSLATERASAITSLLTKSGMSNKVIATELKSYATSNPQDSILREESSDTISLSVTSAETCK